MKPEPPDVIRELSRNGWTMLKTDSPELTKHAIWALGPIIQTTKVAPRVDAKAALSTDREMEFHTDHPRALWIAWHCVNQSSEGGFSLLKDGWEALAMLDAATRDRLREVTIASHQVFTGDLARWPVMRDDLGIRGWLYYTPWLRGQIADPALDAFAEALEKVKTVKVHLKPGEALLINNARMLHGRSAIGGDKNRLLIRHWIAHPQDTFDRDSGW